MGGAPNAGPAHRRRKGSAGARHATPARALQGGDAPRVVGDGAPPRGDVRRQHRLPACGVEAVGLGAPVGGEPFRERPDLPKKWFAHRADFAACRRRRVPCLRGDRKGGLDAGAGGVDLCAVFGATGSGLGKANAQLQAGRRGVPDPRSLPRWCGRTAAPVAAAGPAGRRGGGRRRAAARAAPRTSRIRTGEVGGRGPTIGLNPHARPWRVVPEPFAAVASTGGLPWRGSFAQGGSPSGPTRHPRGHRSARAAALNPPPRRPARPRGSRWRGSPPAGCRPAGPPAGLRRTARPRGAHCPG
jgi:hypothetical protein